MLELAVLGLLLESPMHGYELRKRLTGLLGAFRAFSYGSLYPALRRMQADGLIVEVHPDPETATSDGDQSLDFAEFDAFMDGLRPFVVAVKRGLAARA